jgi:hypothetical protein
MIRGLIDQSWSFPHVMELLFWQRLPQLSASGMKYVLSFLLPLLDTHQQFDFLDDTNQTQFLDMKPFLPRVSMVASGSVLLKKSQQRAGKVPKQRALLSLSISL